MSKKKELQTQLELLKLFLPEILVDHFDLMSSKTEGETLHLYFEEQNKPPVEHVFFVICVVNFLTWCYVLDPKTRERASRFQLPKVRKADGVFFVVGVDGLVHDNLIIQNV